ncbi:MAG: thioredoxin family protein [Syntrophales bacterium]|jgi:thioredoxin 1|nr:thioredoxin family protein [Syntrophales bacterium]
MKDNSNWVEQKQDLEKMLTARNRVIALWYASWCPFCKKFLPIFEKHAEDPDHNFLFVRDDQEIIGEKYAVEVFPTVLFFENGVVSQRLDGIPGVGLTKQQLTEFIAACP